MRRFGLVGYPLTHSFSPAYFSKKFKGLNLEDFSYSLFPIEDIKDICSVLSQDRLEGLNVTIPYKSTVIPFLDEISADARQIGAVNTLKKVNSKWIGYNTDYMGFGLALDELLNGETIRHAMILGSGGSSKAVQYALQKRSVTYYLIGRNQDLNYETLTPSHIRRADLIVNCTPLGMYPNVETFPPIPFEGIAKQHYVMDLVYNPAETALLTKAKILGAKCTNGKRMLEIQAEESWKIWND